MTVLYDIIALLIVAWAISAALRGLLPAPLAQRLRLKPASCAASKKPGCVGCKR